MAAIYNKYNSLFSPMKPNPGPDASRFFWRETKNGKPFTYLLGLFSHDVVTMLTMIILHFVGFIKFILTVETESVGVAFYGGRDKLQICL